ncbi:hypothetical protein Emed_000360 [Eimeria media]
MCAAPGSKTSQLLEALHKAAERERQEEATESDGWPVFPTGAVVANDCDATRSHMGIKLCKIGSRIVYSTCAFNPIENEAVVHAAITKSRGAVVLEDCSNELPLLQRSLGMSKWRVEWEGRWYDSFEEIPKTAKAAKKIRPSMFPPAHTPEAEDVPLHRCMRFFPHVNNTGGFFVAVMRKVRDVPLTPVAHEDNNVEAVDGAIGGHAASEMAENKSAPEKRQDRSDCEEEFVAIEMKSAACSSSGRSRLRRFDQMQLDVVCLDWQSDLLEQQNQQITQQAKRLAPDANEQDLAEGTDGLGGPCSGPTEAASLSCIEQQARSLPLALTRSALEQTRELVFRTLDLPEHVSTCSDAPSDLRNLLSGLCSLLCFRRKTSEGGKPADPDALADDEQSEAGERHPRRVYLISKGVKRLLESTGNSRYKVISGGCFAFHARCKGVYRTTYGGAQWLAPFYETGMRLLVGQKGALGSPTDSILHSGVDGKCSAASVSTVTRRVFSVPRELLYKLVATDQDQRRVDLRNIEELPYGQIVCRESSEGPLLFLTLLPRVDGATNLTSTKIAIPAWRGRTNVELMLDRDTRYALKCLLEEWSSRANGQDPGCVEEARHA